MVNRMESYFFFFYFIITYIFILPSFIKYTGDSLKNYMTINLAILFLEPKAFKYAISVPEPLTQKNSELNEDTCNKVIERAFFFSLSIWLLLPLRLIPDMSFPWKSMCIMRLCTYSHCAGGEESPELQISAGRPWAPSVGIQGPVCNADGRNGVT